jgi:hypothetical protein
MAILIGADGLPGAAGHRDGLLGRIVLALE